MHDVFGGVKRLFWNPGEGRLRAPFRIPVGIVLFWLAALLVTGLVRTLGGFVPVPGPAAPVVSVGLLLVAFVGVTWFIDRRRLCDIGLQFDRAWWADLGAGLAVGLGMVVAVVAVLVVAGLAAVGTPARPGNPDVVLGSGSGALLYGFALFAAFAVLEEYILRGYLLVNIAEGLRGYVGVDRTAVLVAVGTTAGLFGLLHAANPSGSLLSMLNISLAGVLLGLAYVATDRLAFPVGLHVTWNFALGPLFGLPISGLTVDTALVAVGERGPDLVTGGAFGPEGGLVMFVALAVGTGALAVWTRRRHGGFGVLERVAVPDLWSQESSDS